MYHVDDLDEVIPLVGPKRPDAGDLRNSSWIRSFERMNRVHPRHDPAGFQRLRHFVVCFHDSTFECVAWRFELLSTSPDQGVLEAVSKALGVVTR
jgi:hypothetical protein